jgi:hypothetical protein
LHLHACQRALPQERMKFAMMAVDGWFELHCLSVELVFGKDWLWNIFWRFCRFFKKVREIIRTNLSEFHREYCPTIWR